MTLMIDFTPGESRKEPSVFDSSIFPGVSHRNSVKKLVSHGLPVTLSKEPVLSCTCCQPLGQLFVARRSVLSG